MTGIYEVDHQIPKVIRIDDIIEMVAEHQVGCNRKIIESAYFLSAMGHEFQHRVSGEPYLTHPLFVAWKVASWGLDDVTVAAALLHDVLEDCPDRVTPEMIRKNTNDTVLKFVEALTKIEKSSYHSREEKQAEYYMRMLIHGVTDPRILYIKIADRLHNMETLHHLPREKQIRIARETQDIYVPLAYRLGIWEAYADLSDLAFKYLEPEEFENVMNFIKKNFHNAQHILKSFKTELKKLLEKSGFPSVVVEGRIKRPSSIFRKSRRKNVPYSDIFDLLGFRIITDTPMQCYHILGLVHTSFVPISGEFDDYIARPKPNGYQSLHTAVLYTYKGKQIPVEIQIRTWDMHRTAQYGLAAHLIYKGAVKDSDVLTLRLLENFQKLERKDMKKFIESFKELVDTSKIYVFTPRGDIVELPDGATPVDFAYHIHTNIGDHCYQARVNGRIVPLSYRLKNMDRVEIITRKSQEPNEEWLKFVVTKRARQKIRSYLRKKQQEERKALYEEGRKKLFQWTRKYGIHDLDSIATVLRIHFKEAGIKYTLDANSDLFVLIGKNIIKAEHVHHVLETFKKRQTAHPHELPIPSKKILVDETSQLRVITEKQEKLLIDFRRARCCSPLPGDEIILLIKKGQKPKVHLRTCTSIIQASRHNVIENVIWTPGEREPFNVPIHVRTINQPGAMQEILKVFSRMNFSLTRAKGNTENVGEGFIYVEVPIRDKAMLDMILEKLNQLDIVIEAKRGPMQH